MGRMRDVFGVPKGVRTTSLPAAGIPTQTVSVGLPRAQAYTSVPMILLMNDVTLRIRPRYLVRNYAPLSTVPVLIASMARNTLVANTPQALQRKASIRISTQTGKY